MKSILQKIFWYFISGHKTETIKFLRKNKIVISGIIKPSSKCKKNKWKMLRHVLYLHKRTFKLKNCAFRIIVSVNKSRYVLSRNKIV